MSHDSQGNQGVPGVAPRPANTDTAAVLRLGNEFRFDPSAVRIARGNNARLKKQANGASGSLRAEGPATHPAKAGTR